MKDTLERFVDFDRLNAGAIRLSIGAVNVRSGNFVEPDAAAVSGGTVETAINVGEVYAQLVRDLNEGTYRTPGFQHALHNARLIEAVRRAAERGKRQNITSYALEQRRGGADAVVHQRVSQQGRQR